MPPVFRVEVLPCPEDTIDHAMVQEEHWITGRSVQVLYIFVSILAESTGRDKDKKSPYRTGVTSKYCVSTSMNTEIIREGDSLQR